MKIGDQVAVISETISGRVISIHGDEVVIEDEHGFELKYPKSDLVLREGDYRLGNDLVNKEIKEKLRSVHQSEHSLKSFEIDLHIEELTDDHSYMTNQEILTKQMTVCRSFIQNAIEKGQKKIVLIHGKGEGVLKSEIHLFLNKLRNLNGVNLSYHDASYSEYGMGGATEVLFQ